MAENIGGKGFFQRVKESVKDRARGTMMGATVAAGVVMGAESLVPLGEYSLGIPALAQDAPDYAGELKKFLKETYGKKGQELKAALKAVLDSNGPMKTEIPIHPDEWKSYRGLQKVSAMKICFEKHRNGETTASLLVIDSSSPRPRSHDIPIKR